MANKKNNKNVNINDLLKRLEKLEKKVENLVDKNTNVGSNKSKDTNKKSEKKPQVSKGNAGKTGNLEGVVNGNLSVDTDNGVEELSEKQVVDNTLVMGDEVLLEKKGSEVIKVKVARRAKREVVEGLVTSKKDVLYAVTKFNVHKLIDYDVKTKGVLKGFEVNLLLPKDSEDKALVAIIKDVESSGGHKVEDKTNIKQAPSHDPRTLQDDDLV